MSAHALNCYDTIKTRERTQSFKRREAQREDGSSGSVVTNTRRNSSRNSKLTLYPIEIIEETDQQVKFTILATVDVMMNGSVRVKLDTSLCHYRVALRVYSHIIYQY